MGDAVEAFGASHPHGATSGDVVAHLKLDERFRATLEKNSTGAYNVIARLAKRGSIRKEGRTLYPVKENAAPEGAADTGEGEISLDNNPAEREEG